MFTEQCSEFKKLQENSIIERSNKPIVVSMRDNSNLAEVYARKKAKFEQEEIQKKIKHANTVFYGKKKKPEKEKQQLNIEPLYKSLDLGK
jgi:hypothetical protein